jgi:hypothetical protein
MANALRIFLVIMINTFRLDPVQGALYSNFRLVPMTRRAARDPYGSTYEVTEFRFFDGRGKKISPASATNPGGKNGWNEDPSKLIDDNIDSKFLDFNMQPVEFTFNVGVSALSYEWVTGNFEGGERDMISWRLEGKKFATDTFWTTLHTVSNYDTTLNRKAVVGPFLLDASSASYGCSSGLLGRRSVGGDLSHAAYVSSVSPSITLSSLYNWITHTIEGGGGGGGWSDNVLPVCWAMCPCKSYLELVYSLSLYIYI